MSPDAGADLERLRSRMDGIGRAVRIELHRVRSDVLTTDTRARRVLDHVFGRMADVQDLTAPDAGEWRIGCIRSDDLYRTWSRHAEAAAAGGVQPVEVRRWDGDPAALRTDWPGPVSVIRHRDPFTGVTVFAEPLRMAAYLLPDAEPLSVHHLEHLCKYTLRVRLWRAGGVEAHAATAVYRGRGIAMMGDRRSGKTTLAMHLVSRGGSIMGSDLTQLRRGDDGIEIRAVPAVCRIAAETIADNTRLREAMARHGAAEDYLEGPVFFDGKYELYPPTLDVVFGRPVNASTSRLDLVVLPAFSPDRTRQRITRMPAEAASALVRDRLSSDKPLPDWLPFAEVLQRRELEAGPIDGLIERLPPVVQVEFGKEGTLDWGAFDQLVEGCAPQPMTAR